MSEILNVSRRDFLHTGLLAGGGLVLGLHLPSLATGQEPDNKGGPFALNAFVRVGADDSVTVVVNHSEMGQGPYTSVPMLVAEELDADWAKVRFEAAPVAAVYNHTLFPIQMTGGSTSTWTEWERVRKAGAAARALLIAAAAAEWKVEPATCGTDRSSASHQRSARAPSPSSSSTSTSRSHWTSPARGMRDATDCMHDDGAPHRRGGDVRSPRARTLARRCARDRRVPRRGV